MAIPAAAVTACCSLDGVVLGWSVTATFLREHMDDLRAAGHRCGIAKRFFEKGNVVTIEGAGIANAECFEERGWFERFADGRFGCVKTGLGNVSDDRKVGEQLFEFGLTAHVHRVVTDLDETFAEF